MHAHTYYGACTVAGCSAGICRQLLELLARSLLHCIVYLDVAYIEVSGLQLA